LHGPGHSRRPDHNHAGQVLFSWPRLRIVNGSWPSLPLWSCIVCRNLSRTLSLSLLFLLSLLSLCSPFCGLTFLLLVASRLSVPFLAYTFLYNVPRSRSTIFLFISPEELLWFCGCGSCDNHSDNVHEEPLETRDSQPHCIGNLRDLRILKSSRLELGYQGTFDITERNWALRFDTLCPRPSEVRVI
jgi:hypothetical protein